MNTEQVLYKKSRTGTTVSLFSTHLDSFGDESGSAGIGPFQTYVSGVYPSYLTFDNLGKPNGLYTFNGEYLWHQDERNIDVTLSSHTAYYMSGYGASYVSENTMTEINRTTINSKFKNLIDETVQEPNFTCAFFHEEEIEDLYVDVKLERTCSLLPTLSIQNQSIGQFPIQESKTGVLFGRLVARQQVKDENGNSVLIPLKNVPVGIFNESEDYPTISSVDGNGDRVALNLKESSGLEEYFNIESFSADTGSFLRSGSNFNQVPEQYKYITTTNENGEFIIHNAPTGPQTVIFEADLFKQGLTKDEIALNFFPFPINEESTADLIPSFFFRQIPTTILPSWGDFQTGYTEMNITVNLDLRKWSTYIFPPTSVRGLKTEQAISQNAGNTTKIEIRDMTVKDFEDKPVKVAQVFNDLDRDKDHQYQWINELPAVRSKVEYGTFGCNVLKVPGNIYDPNGFVTDKNGEPTGKKGVWLSAYQFKISANSSVSRKTGSIRAWNGNTGTYNLSHYDVNYTWSNGTAGVDAFPKSGIGEFPYEKPWSATYPNKYSIPRKPFKQRFSYENGRTPIGTNGAGQNVYFLIEPAFEDGDLIGFPFNTGSETVGGFSVQSLQGGWFPNRTSQVATRDFMYKYEKGVSWNEGYANGYQPYWDENTSFPFGGVSNVEGGEKYQRTECGYGYYMKPQGWPRIVRQIWNGDTPIEGMEIGKGLVNYGDPENPGPGSLITNQVLNRFNLYEYDLQSHYNDVYNIDNQNISLCLDPRANMEKGMLDIYRIVDSGENTVDAGEFIIPTSIILNNGNSSFRCYWYKLTNEGDIQVKIRNDFNLSVYTPLGTIPVGGTIVLNPGETMTANNSNTGVDSVGWTGVRLQGNSELNVLTNKYERAKYGVQINYNGSVNNGQSVYGQTINKLAETIPDTWYCKTHHDGEGNAGETSLGFNTGYNPNGANNAGDRVIWGLRIENNSSEYIE